MTKKLVSQQSKHENSEISSHAEASTEPSTSSVNQSRSVKKANNKTKYDYSYYTPLKKIKINPIFQMAPKKKKISLEYNGLTIRGKNLFNIFKSM